MNDFIQSHAARRTRFFLLAFLLVVAVVPAHSQEASPAEITTLPHAINLAQTYQFGDDSNAMEFIRERVLEVQLNPVARNEVANMLAVLLSEPKSTYAFRLFVCKQLYVIGGEEQVEELTPLLADPELAHVARYALEVIPGDTVNDALWAAAETATGPVAAGIAATLAARGGPSAVSRLAILSEREEPVVVRTALVGLGKVGGAQAESALRIALAAAPDTVHTEIHEALLACAEHYRASGENVEADRLYQELYGEERPLAVRLAAFDALVDLHGEQAAPQVAERIASGDAMWVRVAMAHVRTLGGPQSTALFAAQLATVPPDVQVLLIQALGDRGDAAALDTVIGGLNSAEADVRYATIAALGQLGNETTVIPLLNVAMGDDETARKRAQVSLARLADAGVNGALMSNYEQAPPAGKVLLSELFADRDAVEALPQLLESVRPATGEVRSANYGAIGMLAAEDTLPQMAALFYDAEDQAERTEASRSLATALRRIPPSESRTGTMTSLYSSAPDSVTRSALIGLYRDLGDPGMLPVLEEAVQMDDPIVRDAAVSALAGWPDATPVEAVYALAATAETDAHKQTALDGYIRMLRLESDRPVEKKLAGFENALALSTGPDATRAILAGLSELKSTAALDVVEGMLGDETLHAEAAVAAEKIRSKYYRATASVTADTAQNAVDGSIYSFWQTPGPQEPGQWIEIDLFRRAEIKGLVLDTSRTKTCYPRAYSIYVYEKGGLPGEPVAVGEGTEGVTSIDFIRPVSGQVLRIEQTGATDELPWVVHEVRVIPN